MLRHRFVTYDVLKQFLYLFKNMTFVFDNCDHSGMANTSAEPVFIGALPLSKHFTFSLPLSWLSFSYKQALTTEVTSPAHALAGDSS